MTKCCIYKCNNVGVHRFPIKRDLLRSWIKAIGRGNWRPTSSSRLCRDHFKPSDFASEGFYSGIKLKRKLLSKTAIPSIFPWNKHKKDTETVNKQDKCIIEEKKVVDYAQQLTQIVSEHSYYSIQEKCLNNTSEQLGILSQVKEEPISTSSERCLESSSEPLKIKEESLSDEQSARPQKSDVGTQIDIHFTYGTISRFKKDFEAIRFYTGFESYEKFLLVYSTLRARISDIKFHKHCVLGVPYEDQFFLTLMKLRQNKTLFELSRFFDISMATTSNIFITWVNFIYRVWNESVIWPDKKVVDFYMPDVYKAYDKAGESEEKPTSGQASNGNSLKNEGSSEETNKSISKNQNFQLKNQKLIHSKNLGKTYKILQTVLDHNFITLSSKIYYICFICCNFREGIVK